MKPTTFFTVPAWTWGLTSFSKLAFSLPQNVTIASKVEKKSNDKALKAHVHE